MNKFLDTMNFDSEKIGLGYTWIAFFRNNHKNCWNNSLLQKIKEMEYKGLSE